ncbi:hypothetical protein U1Q18_027640 [Sarracenia purpurea var. burkii]
MSVAFDVTLPWLFTLPRRFKSQHGEILFMPPAVGVSELLWCGSEWSPASSFAVEDLLGIAFATAGEPCMLLGFPMLSAKP